MKKTKLIFIVLALLLGSVFLFNACYTAVHAISKGRVSKELIIEPDPDNPFQGTWIDSTGYNLHVIKGMNGTLYTFGAVSYNEHSVYIIERSGNIYITSTNNRIRVDNDILTIGDTSYKRVTK